MKRSSRKKKAKKVITPEEEIEEEEIEEEEEPKEGKKLTLRQELFCKNYTSMEKEFFGNGVASYINAYKLNKSIKMHYDSARVNAAKLLTNANICKRINELLEEGGFNDQNVDKQTLFLINQQFDYRAKAKGIEIYNKLKKRGADGELPKSIDNLGEKLAKLSGDFVREMLRGRDIKNGNNGEAFNPKTD